jgi:hypothetical protein
MKVCRSAYRGFCWFPKWLNCITWRPGDPKIYKWGWWHFIASRPATTTLDNDTLCPHCGHNYFVNETILENGELGCKCLARHEVE